MALAIEFDQVEFAYPQGSAVLTASTCGSKRASSSRSRAQWRRKTTLLRLALGLERPTRGEVRLFGDRHELRPSSPDRVPRTTLAARTARAGDRARGRRGGARAVRLLRTSWPGGCVARRNRARARRALRVGVAAAVAPLLGQQQRAFIAKALASGPSCWCSTSRRPASTSRRRTRSLSYSTSSTTELGVTILYVSHEFGAVERFVRRLVLVRERIVFDGPPSQLPASGTTHLTSMLDFEFMRLAFAAGAIVGCSRRRSASSSSSAR